MMKHHWPKLFAGDAALHAQASAVAAQIVEWSAFAQETPGLASSAAAAAAAPVKVALHTSCGARREMGTHVPSEALRRRCLYLHLDYPPPEREREIVRTRVPGIPEHLAGQIAAFVGSLRRLDLRQRPSVTQTLEWARTLLALGAQDLNVGLAAESLPVLLAYRSDIELAAAELGLPAG